MNLLAVEKVAVVVTFLRMDRRPTRLLSALPAGAVLARAQIGVAAYRALYHEVGAPWLWWLRSIMSDEELGRHLANPKVAVFLLRVNGAVAGFYETEAGAAGDVNLNYFGLVPGMIGKGLGTAALAAAIDGAFRSGDPLTRMTVNTCTADHPRALPNYLAAGFVETRRVREVWDIPRRLGLSIPAHLRV